MRTHNSFRWLTETELLIELGFFLMKYEGSQKAQILLNNQGVKQFHYMNQNRMNVYFGEEIFE